MNNTIIKKIFRAESFLTVHIIEWHVESQVNASQSNDIERNVDDPETDHSVHESHLERQGEGEDDGEGEEHALPRGHHEAVGLEGALHEQAFMEKRMKNSL